MFSRMPVDFDKDLQPVGQLANSLLFLIARPGLPVNTLKDLVAHAKAHPDTLSYGSAGVGTTPHLAGELFKQAAGIAVANVPYRGAAPAIQDVMAGQADFAFAPGTVLPSMKAGKLKVLAVASHARSTSAPAIPTFEELVMPTWWRTPASASMRRPACRRPRWSCSTANLGPFNPLGRPGGRPATRWPAGRPAH